MKKQPFTTATASVTRYCLADILTSSTSATQPSDITDETKPYGTGCVELPGDEF